MRPYFGLRSYQDAGEHYTGQLGSEATPAEFVDALLAATAEMVRVLKPSGSIFVNLGDKYAGSDPYGRNNNGSGGTLKNPADKPRVVRTDNARMGLGTRPDNQGVPTKSLIGIPWRYALRCIDDLGLILRAEIIWSKPNGLPESVTDRVRRSHEQWFHFTVRPRYYSAVDEIREGYSDTASARSMREWQLSLSENTSARTVHRDQTKSGGQSGLKSPDLTVNPLGKLPGSVWSVPTQPLSVPAHLGVDHFAAFPMEWPRRLIRGWSPPGVCSGCGEGRRPVVALDRRVLTGNFGNDMAGHGQDGRHGARAETWASVTGYACACPDTTAPTTPAVVLDPFGGTGTTALVAHALGRHGISVDMSADYCRLAEWRCNDRGQLAAALEVDKPAAVPDGQLDIFGEALA